MPSALARHLAPALARLAGVAAGQAVKFADLRSVREPPSAGAGARSLASAQYQVNVSVDVAVGRNDDHVCFCLGEAF